MARLFAHPGPTHGVLRPRAPFSPRWFPSVPDAALGKPAGPVGRAGVLLIMSGPYGLNAGKAWAGGGAGSAADPSDRPSAEPQPSLSGPTGPTPHRDHLMSDTNPKLILALDTAQEDCAAALFDARTGRVTERVERVRNKHAERLLTLVGEVLMDAGVSKKDVDLVAFGAGPGAFTGLRVACGVAQGLAWALDRMTAPVANTEALAHAFAKKEGLAPKTRIFVANDARMAECYAAVYEVAAAGERLVTVTAPELMKPEAVAAAAREAGAALILGSAPAAYPEAFEGVTDLRIVAESASRPAAIAEIAVFEAASGETVQPSLAAPFYVRNRVALTMAERAAGERL